MSKVKTVLLFILIFSATTFADQLDISSEYLYAKAQAQNNTLDENLLKGFLKNQTVLLVPGVLSESFMSESDQKLKINFLMGEIFDDHEQWLLEEELDYEKIVLESESSPEDNADFINEVIDEIKGDIILFTHSKGGIDTFMALSKRPDLLKRVTGIITVQTPFHGSDVAEGFSKNILTKAAGGWLFNILGGSKEGMESLTNRDSKKRLEEYENEFQHITSSVPVINFGSFKENTFGWDTPLEFLRDYTDIKVGKNDGVVPLKNAFLEDAYKVTESGVDHLLSVTDCKGIKRVSFAPKLRYSERWSYDRVAHFKALLESLRKVSY
jgi:pimeloyl-ACP methyl ester carboxylesterase